MQFKARTAHSAYIGRFAPSPSGKLHQGSLIAALASYLHARWHGGTWLVRMEDVDTSRCTRVMGEHQLATLRALGFEFNESVMWQTERYPAYRAALEQLLANKLIYPCACTRSQIAQRQSELKTLDYPKTCAHGIGDDVPVQSWRLRADNQRITWQDESGEVFTQTVDDCALKRGAWMLDAWTYQMAVVVDDAAQGITHVVRGEDLRESTARQIALQHALGYSTPQYSHAPLLTNAAGEKLSKSEQAPELDLLHGGAALQHAWEFLGGAPMVVTDTHDFWRQINAINVHIDTIVTD